MKSILKLLRSMRFAIGILTVVAVASTVGSILEQNQPSAIYVSRYGAVWSAFYSLCGLDDVYHAWWFFGLLGFMALSTGLCVLQNAPGMWKEMRTYREHKSMESLRKLEYSAQYSGVQISDELMEKLGRYLKKHGYTFLQTTTEGVHLIAARRGAARRAGYIFVHSAMVLICIGGLVDGNVFLRLRLWTGQARIETRDLLPKEVPGSSRLIADAGSFRATMNIPEGDTSATALVPLGDGYLLQELPFALKLNHFRVEHYASGQPKDFASDIEIVDGTRRLPVTLQVNKPFTYKGVTLYQSGFADGGSEIELDVSSPGRPTQKMKGKIGGAVPFLLNGTAATLELTDLRLINVFARDDGGPAVGWHSNAKPGERVHDVGPSLGFRIRDQQGQAEEWLLYERPAEIDGANWFLVGRRKSDQTSMQYWRLPADPNGSLNAYRDFSASLQNPESRALAGKTLSARATDRRVAAALETAVTNLLDAFAKKGYGAVAELLPAGGPQEEKLRTAQLYARLLESAAETMDKRASPTLVRNMLASYSETLDAQLPAVFQLTNIRVVNASGIQITHAPGANLVYLGAALLALGVIGMYFIPERRLWIRVSTKEMLLAFTANRPSPALLEEFARLKGEFESIIRTHRKIA